MKSVRLHDKQDLRFDEIQMARDPGPNEARVKVAYAGICGSDVHNYRTGQWILRKPSVAGHEFSGWVDSIGDAVTNFKIGDRVVADSRYACGTCGQCKVGAKHLCTNLGFIGEAIDGGFAEFVTLPIRLLIKCQANISMDLLALAEPLAVALHALNQINICDDDPLLIVGCGSIGTLAAIASNRLPGREIFLSDVNKDRLTLVCKLTGATPVDISLFDQFKFNTKKPIRHVLDTTGNVGVISNIISKLNGCNLGLVGIGCGNLELDPVHLVEREISLIGCHAFCD